MIDVPAHPGSELELFIYGGRFADQVLETNIPDGCNVLSEWDVLPHELYAVMDRAAALVLLDLFSFPYEAMADEHWDVPMTVVPPPNLGTETLTSIFGGVLFERLGFFDRFATANADLWEDLRKRYRWPKSKRLAMKSDDPGKAVTELLALFEGGVTGAGVHDPRCRDERTQAPEMSPAYGIRRTGFERLRFEKAAHRVQIGALGRRFEDVLEERGGALDVLEVGCGEGRRASSLDSAKVRFSGVDVDGDAVMTARSDFPEGRFERLGQQFTLPYDDESFDLAFSVTFLSRYPAPVKRSLVSEMWRVTRPDGHLLFLEEFVTKRGKPEEPAVHPLSVSEFMEMVVGATEGRVLLEHVESLRYPCEHMFTGGLISVSKLSTPAAR